MTKLMLNVYLKFNLQIDCHFVDDAIDILISNFYWNISDNTLTFTTLCVLNFMNFLTDQLWFFTVFLHIFRFLMCWDSIENICYKYLCISRSNFVNASPEKFSPVSKVLHRIQNKFSWQSVSNILPDISFSLSVIASYQCAHQMEHVAFCWFWSQAFCVLLVLVETPASWRTFCRRSWNGFPLIYDRWPPPLLRSNAHLKSNRTLFFPGKKYHTIFVEKS